MSPRSSSKGGNPSPDVYVGLLFVSVSALIAGCIFLAMALDKYDWTLAK